MTVNGDGDARKINIWNFEIQRPHNFNRFCAANFSCFERIFENFHFFIKNASQNAANGFLEDLPGQFIVFGTNRDS